MTATLKPGIYRLTASVQNPRPDRRVRHKWTAQAIWPKGMHFYVQQGTHFYVQPGAVIYAGKFAHQRVRLADRERLGTLCDYLEPLPVSSVPLLLEYHARVECHADVAGALEALVRRGKVTLEDLDTAFREAADSPPQEQP